jgi:hypothetical protein
MAAVAKNNKRTNNTSQNSFDGAIRVRNQLKEDKEGNEQDSKTDKKS